MDKLRKNNPISQRYHIEQTVIGGHILGSTQLDSDIIC